MIQNYASLFNKPEPPTVPIGDSKKSATRHHIPQHDTRSTPSFDETTDKIRQPVYTHTTDATRVVYYRATDGSS